METGGRRKKPRFVPPSKQQIRKKQQENACFHLIVIIGALPRQRGTARRAHDWLVDARCSPDCYSACWA
jgi:hypothetical protein